MKKLIGLLLIICLTWLSVKSQTLYGYAGQNTAVNYTPEVRAYILDITPDNFVLDFCQYKYTGKAPDQDINNIIALHNEFQAAGKNLYLIYSFDARNKLSIIDNFYAFDKLIEGGVNIIACRAGNEEWAKVAHNNNWSLYMAHCTPILNELTAKGFTGNIIFPIRRPAEAGTWNANAILFINSNPQYAPDCHPYWNKDSAPVLIDIDAGRELPKEVVSGQYLSDKDIFYSTLYSEITEGNFYDDVIAYHRANFPNKKMWVTEGFTAVGVGVISGTVGYEAAFDWVLNRTLEDQDIIAAVCRFNGAGITGSITPLSKNDIVTGNQFIKRLGYYTLRNFLHNQNSISYHNLTREAKDLTEAITVPTGMRLTNAWFECLNGANFYSSSGATAWYNTGSLKMYEISDVAVYDYIPELSYGYIHSEFEPIPIYGCTSQDANNYDPNANTDNGSCLFDVIGCMDREAINYNPLATINEGCEYKPVECLKKRWLFLGCKVAKTNCNCN